VDFEFLAGDPALDFVATVAEWTSSHVERLTSPEDLADWLVQAGLLDIHPSAGQADLTEARELRLRMYEFLLALTSGHPVARDARTMLNRYAAGPLPLVTLTTAGLPATTGSVMSGLTQLARHAIALAADDRRPYISWCDDDSCTRAFLDRSRGRRRRWCGMTGCGDRAKAAAYRRRRGAASSGVMP
jgi:predicted RNA-binding Zn ribbon-like protein